MVDDEIDDGHSDVTIRDELAPMDESLAGGQGYSTVFLQGLDKQIQGMHCLFVHR